MNQSRRLDKNIKHVLIISLDCVRREALGCYPQQFPWQIRFPNGPQTPNLDQLCSQGHRFDQAITQAPFTPASHASLLTGLTPPNHGLRTLLGSKLNENVTTLAEVLAAEGWQCGAVVGSHALSREYELDRGFHFYDDNIQTGISNWILGERRDATDVTNRAVDWLQSGANNERLFLFVHYFDAHGISIQSLKALNRLRQEDTPDFDERPQAVPPSFRQHLRPFVRPLRSALRPVRRQMHAAYQSGLNYFEASGGYRGMERRFMLNEAGRIDVQIGRLLQTLQEQGRLDETLIVILADHGEDFREHGETVSHLNYLYETTLRVPLILYPRLGERLIIDQQVQLVDLFPTVLSVLGISYEGKVDGTNLMDLINASPNTSHTMWVESAYSETAEVEPNSAFNEEPGSAELMACKASLRLPGWKLIWNRLDETYQLYRIDRDPDEHHNLAGDNPDLVNKLAEELRGRAGAMPGHFHLEDDIVIQRLEALGYI